MPELPEVETVRRGLLSLVRGRTVVRVEVLLPRIVRSPSVEEFQKRLAGKTIHNILRRGKYLIFDFGSLFMISHLRMEGQYRVSPPGEERLLHTHVVFFLDDGTELRYRDVRQFGTMDLGETSDDFPLGLKSLGPEPFDDELSAMDLYKRIHHRKTPIKPVLLDQTVLAGLGNIYVDEALFHAGIHPELPANRVTKVQAGLLLESIRSVLLQAIESGGSSIRSYVDGYGRHGGFQIQLFVYQQTGKPCRLCGTEIEKIRLGGRGTHFCPHCQSKRKRMNHVRETPTHA